MLNSISNNTSPQFTGKTFSHKSMRDVEECAEKIYKYSKHHTKDNYAIPFCIESYQEVVPKHPKLEKFIWGYRVPNVSKELRPYQGTINIDAGLSTEAGGYGGGWLKGDLYMPLSTKDVHTCAVVNLVNEFTGEQFMYHVYDGTNKYHISDLLEQQFPRFTKANILPGDRRETNKTVNNIIDAVDYLNPKATKTFYYMADDNPEIVAIGGELQYIKNTNPSMMTFRQVTDQYHY